MSELDLAGEHANMTISQLVDRAQLDVVRNGETKTVPVKQLLHGVHDGEKTVAQALATKATPKPAASSPVINPAMSVSSFRTSERARLNQRAKFERDQQQYLSQGGAPDSQDYW